MNTPFFYANAARICWTAAGAMELGLQEYC
jgi:hypothetical protein